jgi:hypothetical protein
MGSFLTESSTEAVPAPVVLERGDHIRVFRAWFWHHGLFLGGDEVIHVASDQRRHKQTAKVRRSTLAEFADGGSIEKVAYGKRLPPDESVARAEACLGGSGYHLTANNCEHFVTWCVTGERSSTQVEDVSSGAALVSGATLAPRAGINLVAGAGEMPAKSASNLMSGLKTVGGGSAAAGLGVLAAGGAVVGAGSICLILRDRPCLTDAERSARTAGRVGGVGGGVLGAGAVVCSVGALGVSGYGAAGLSSGLATLGAHFGGGMVAGIAVTVAAPLLLAVLLAAGCYYVARRYGRASEAIPTI